MKVFVVMAEWGDVFDSAYEDEYDARLRAEEIGNSASFCELEVLPPGCMAKVAPAEK